MILVGARMPGGVSKPRIEAVSGDCGMIRQGIGSGGYRDGSRPMEPSVGGFVDKGGSAGEVHPGEIEGVEIAIGRE